MFDNGKMPLIFMVLGLVFLGYYIIMILYAGPSVSYGIIWPAAAALFFAFGIFLVFIRRRGIVLPVLIRTAGILVATGCIIIFAVVECLIFSATSSDVRPDLEYIIVLGAKVRGKNPSKALDQRLETAYTYLSNNPHTIAVLSGGQGADEDISEAEAMYRYLVDAGISEARLIKEEKSTDTMQNIENSYSLIGDAATGIVTQDFHIFRSVALAKKQGHDAVGIVASSKSPLQLHYFVREFFAVLKDAIAGNI